MQTHFINLWLNYLLLIDFVILEVFLLVFNISIIDSNMTLKPVIEKAVQNLLKNNFNYFLIHLGLYGIDKMYQFINLAILYLLVLILFREKTNNFRKESTQSPFYYSYSPSNISGNEISVFENYLQIMSLLMSHIYNPLVAKTQKLQTPITHETEILQLEILCKLYLLDVISCLWYCNQTLHCSVYSRFSRS